MCCNFKLYYFLFSLSSSSHFSSGAYPARISATIPANISLFAAARECFDLEPRSQIFELRYYSTRSPFTQNLSLNHILQQTVSSLIPYYVAKEFDLIYFYRIH